MREKQIQIDRSLFVDMCRFFGLIDGAGADKTALERSIKDGLGVKIKAIQKRIAYEDMQRAKGTDDYQQALLDYLAKK